MDALSTPDPTAARLQLGSQDPMSASDPTRPPSVPTHAPTGAPEPPAAGPRALVEVLDRDGQVRQAWPVAAWPLRIGRALDNDVVLTEPHVAAHHLLIGADGAVLVFTVGDTRNGIAVGSGTLRGGERLELPWPRSDLDLVIGRTRLRLRLAGAVLAPEQALSMLAARELRLGPTLLVAAALLGAIAFGAWLETDPIGSGRAVGNALLTSLAGAGVWCGGWALLSKTFTRQSHFGWHLRVFLIASAVLVMLGVVPALLAFAFSWPWATDYSYLAVYAVGAVAIYFHLLAVEPARARLMRAVVTVGALVGIALAVWFNVQRTDSAGDELYMSHLFPPALRVARTRPVGQLVESLAPLHATLDRKAREPALGDAAGQGEKGDDEQ